MAKFLSPYIDGNSAGVTSDLHGCNRDQSLSLHVVKAVYELDVLVLGDEKRDRNFCLDLGLKRKFVCLAKFFLNTVSI